MGAKEADIGESGGLGNHLVSLFRTACVGVVRGIAAEPMHMRFLALVLVLCGALAGCASRGEGKWPTLAPRPGELSPLVPRTPLGSCVGCGQDVFPVPAPPVAPVILPVSADIGPRIAASDKAIASVEAAYPAQARTTAAAIKAAGSGNIDAITEAEVQRSRLESILLPLAIESRALDSIEDDLVGKADAAPRVAQVQALRARIAALEATRDLP